MYKSTNSLRESCLTRVVYLQRIRIASLGIIILFCIGLILPSLDVSQDITGENNIENVFQVAESLHIQSNEDWELKGWSGNGTSNSALPSTTLILLLISGTSAVVVVLLLVLVIRSRKNSI